MGLHRYTASPFLLFNSVNFFWRAAALYLGLPSAIMASANLFHFSLFNCSSTSTSRRSSRVSYAYVNIIFHQK